MNLVLVEHIELNVAATEVLSDLHTTSKINLALMDLGFGETGGHDGSNVVLSERPEVGELAQQYLQQVLQAPNFQVLGRIMRKSSLRTGFTHFAIQISVGAQPTEQIGALVTDLPPELLIPQRGMELFNRLPRPPVESPITPMGWSQSVELDISQAGLPPLFPNMPNSCGLSIPLYGVGRMKGFFHLINAPGAANPRKFLNARVAISTLLSLVALTAVRRLMEEGRLLHSPPALSARERECLVWAAAGKTAWETAQILGITERTANFHLQNVIRKFGVTNKAQALSLATASGLI
jgi:DNA-binding CsgD family transcriptional regulator